jgi:Ala-tRNA(Pro) deacylase
MSLKEVGNVTSFFDSLGIAYERFEHQPVRTSEEAARVRGCPVEDGVKAMVLDCKRGDRQFYAIADIPADRKLDLKKLKEILKADEVKLCPLDKVESATGCAPGGVPPLGHTPKLPILADNRLFARQSSEFNAGLNTVSVRLKTSDLRVAFEKYGAAFFDFSL